MSTRLRIPFLRDPHECEEVRELMTDYLDAELADPARIRVDRHVRFCPRCRRALGNLRITIDRLAGLGSASIEPPDDDAIAERIAARWSEGSPPDR
jgi:anti-sigma factor RsiW